MATTILKQETFLDIYQTENEQVEAIKLWWKENGKSVIFGVILGLMAIFGWRAWQDFQIEQAANASRLYQEMIIAARENKPDSVRKKANEIATTYKSTIYAVFAKLELAKLAVAEGDLNSAADYLQWALDNIAQDSLGHVIRLRLARVFIAQNKLSEAKSQLGTGADSGEFSVSYQELEADILRLEGNSDAARAAYEKALNTARNAGQDTAILDMKLDDLGRSDAQ